jgi:hypothetical protein
MQESTDKSSSLHFISHENIRSHTRKWPDFAVIGTEFAGRREVDAQIPQQSE